MNSGRPRRRRGGQLNGPLRASILTGRVYNPEGFARLLRWLAGAMLALSLVGCGQRWAPGVTARVDPDLEFSVQVNLWIGVDDWCFATAGAGCLDLETGTSAPAFLKRPRHNGTAAFIPPAGVVELDLSSPTLTPTKKLAAIKHEIGHAFGIPHQPKGLMRGAPEGPWRRRAPGCIDSHTLAKFCELHPCALPVRPECEE